jgi:hypothetical protein
MIVKNIKYQKERQKTTKPVKKTFIFEVEDRRNQSLNVAFVYYFTGNLISKLSYP